MTYSPAALVSPHARRSAFLCCEMEFPCSRSEDEHFAAARQMDAAFGSIRRYLKGLAKMLREDLCDFDPSKDKLNVGNLESWVRSLEYQILDITPEREHKGGWVYFIQCGEYVKIGLSADVDARLKALQTSTPYPLALIKKFAVPDPAQAEARLHVYFEDRRHAGEWFALTPDEISEVMDLDSIDLEHIDQLVKYKRIPDGWQPPSDTVARLATEVVS